ncbi:Crp/Fnr family transcriptional regulator [Spirochaetia bacterium]|nr:Crp/Fnr family transcriptional regulator [Spirochaetia bacterium]
MATRPQFEVVKFSQGDYIYLEGTRSDIFYVITQGKVQITGEAQTLTTEDTRHLLPGDFLGMVAVMSEHPHIDNAQAMSAVSLIAISKKQFIALIQSNPSVAMKIMVEFSRRIRFCNEALAVATNKPVSSDEDTSTLFKTAKFYEKEKRFSQASYAYRKYLERFPDGEFAEEAKAKIDELKNEAKAPAVKGTGRIYEKGRFLFADGEIGNELFVLLSGSVQICKVLGDNEMVFAMLKQGDIFGEMALVEDKPRSASAIAYEDCSVMVVEKKNFEGMSVTQPNIIERLTKLLADRIWFSYKQLANTALEDPVARIYDAMVMHLEKNREQMDSHTTAVLNFGPKELTKMIGLAEEAAKPAMNKILLEDKTVQFGEKQIKSLDNLELVKMADFYKGVQRRQKLRKKQ